MSRAASGSLLRSPNASRCRRGNVVIGSIYLMVAVAALLSQASSPLILLLVPFVLGSHVVHLVIAYRARSMGAQCLTGIAMAAFMIWATYVYVSAMYWHRDAQSAIALLFITPYSLPVLAPLWLWIGVREQRFIRQSADPGAARPPQAEP